MEPSNDVALDIIVTNVVSVFRTRCHLNLRTIGLEGTNVIYKPEVGVRFSDFKVVNVLAVCSLPFQIRLIEFTKNNRPIASYEPEIHPAASYRIKNLRSTVQVFSTGNITVTGPNVQSVASAVEQIYPLLFECQKTLS
ncbi:TATA box-binding 1 [Labeo rohita]|uniref:TATA box-binding protein-like 1 n=1 Tax=Labeo rohita TaxID=84645 RepID=A0A498L3S6_LABRO|nr:TATA box-binding 1 [Labeo rohita]